MTSPSAESERRRVIDDLFDGALDRAPHERFAREAMDVERRARGPEHHTSARR